MEGYAETAYLLPGEGMTLAHELYYHSAINTYYSAYTIRPANLLLKAAFKLF